MHTHSHQKEIGRWQNDFAQAQLIDKEGTPAEAKKLGLLDGEFELICQKIGRQPSFTELCMFSGMWSEHCSYKNSILLLKTLYSQSERLLAKPGEENAGALRISPDKAVVFKIESHNHPSAIEPYQGAATGVGGIMRDIFTMGARPLVSLNSLRFGSLSNPRNKYLFSQVVKGIGDYGNSLGIACAGGEVFFHERFTGNPLVNAMTVGIADIDAMASNNAKYPNNLVVYVGAKTGRDGIHGASFASKELSNQSAEERSAVQVGDPFMEKLVMEATLECLAGRHILAIQDMGAAGLLSSSSEMSSAGNIGMDLHLERVPAREENMLPFEYLLSESQERMLMVVAPEKYEMVKQIFEKWKLSCTVIGITTEQKNLRIFHEQKLYADLPAKTLTVNAEGAPRYQRPIRKPAYLINGQEAKGLDFIASLWNSLPENGTRASAFPLIEEKIISFVKEPNLCSKHALYEQYDTDIGISRVMGPGQNCGVYRVEGTDLAIAATVDCNSLYVYNNPFAGTQLAVAEALRNIVSSGALPIGITNCLNFANPYKEENYYYFSQAIAGMSSAAEFFKIPITGGNVSFYNESNDVAVLPTPTIGMVGLLEDQSFAVASFVRHNCHLFFVGFFNPTLNSSQLAEFLKVQNHGHVPYLNLSQEASTMQAILELAQSKTIHACIDLSLGGLYLAMLRLSQYRYGEAFGFQLHLDELHDYLMSVAGQSPTIDDMLFGETSAGYIVAVEEEKLDDFEKIKKEVPCLKIGVIEQNIEQQISLGDKKIILRKEKILQSYYSGLDQAF